MVLSVDISLEGNGELDRERYMKYVIVGNGIAGTCAAEAIREVDSEGSIHMVGDEIILPMAGNYLMTELILSTGAVDMMLVDYQCIMPSLGTVAACYHTKMISTSGKARFPGMEHREFHPDNARRLAEALVKEAIENFTRRGNIYIPVEPVPAPEWYSEKAVTIGVYFVASGVYTVLGPMPPVTGSLNVVNLLTEGLNDVVGATS